MILDNFYGFLFFFGNFSTFYCTLGLLKGFAIVVNTFYNKYLLFTDRQKNYLLTNICTFEPPNKIYDFN